MFNYNYNSLNWIQCILVLHVCMFLHWNRYCNSLLLQCNCSARATISPLPVMSALPSLSGMSLVSMFITATISIRHQWCQLLRSSEVFLFSDLIRESNSQHWIWAKVGFSTDLDQIPRGKTPIKTPATCIAFPNPNNYRSVSFQLAFQIQIRSNLWNSSSCCSTAQFTPHSAQFTLVWVSFETVGELILYLHEVRKE